jgi:protein-S-isoprenylcysteine O-methyltransferase Ste14
MNKNLFFAFVGLCVFTHFVRFVYEILKHKKLLKPGKTSFVIILVNMLLLWASWFILCSIDVYKIDLASGIRYLGIALTITGGIVFLVAFFTIKTLESYDGQLITSGIYSKISHPMYLGFILWLLGYPIFCGALFSFVLSFLFIANVLFWKHLEEIELEKRFLSYKEYRKTTFF